MSTYHKKFENYTAVSKSAWATYGQANESILCVHIFTDRENRQIYKLEPAEALGMGHHHTVCNFGYGPGSRIYLQLPVKHSLMFRY